MFYRVDIFVVVRYNHPTRPGGVMVAAHVRGACEAIRGGSIPLPGTKEFYDWYCSKMSR